MLNRDLFLQLADHFEKHPESWEQKTWFEEDCPSSSCGSIGCIAGWAVMINGDFKPYWEGGRAWDFLKPVSAAARATFTGDEDGDVSVDIEDAAEWLLGLDYDTASFLFSPYLAMLEDNLPEMLREIANSPSEENVYGIIEEYVVHA